MVLRYILRMTTVQKTDNLQKIESQKIIQAAMSFPMDDVLKKYCEEHSLLMETARQHEREIKRFLVLSTINSNTEYTMSGPIDQIWHAFILFTKKYSEFCNLVAGRFLHHFPSIPGEAPIDLKGYAQLLEDYKALFNEE